MKKKLIAGMLSATLAITSVSAQEWTQIDSTIPEASTIQSLDADLTLWNLFGNWFGPASIENVKTNLKKSTYPSSVWQVHYRNLDSTTSMQAPGETSKFLMYAGSKTSSTANIYSNAHAKFNLSPDALSASKVRISLDLSYYDNSDSVDLNLTVSGSGWTAVEVTPELRGMGIQSDGQDYIPSAKFTCGLINLADGTIFDAQVAGMAEPFTLGLEDANYFVFSADENGVMTVSFELGASDLASITEAGLALFIRSEKAGEVIEIFEVGNFKVEVLEGLVPEPSAYAAIFGLVCLAAGLMRRRFC